MRRTLLLVCALVLGLPSAARATDLRGSVLGNGGASVSGSGRQLTGTVGQSVVGASAGSGRVLCHGFWCFGGSRVVSVEEPPPSVPLPERLELGPPYPNPARAGARFAIALPKTARVALTVHDVNGRVLRRIEAVLEAGWRTLPWEGDDESGRALEAGLYFARLAVDGVVVGTRRIAIRR